MCIYIHIFRQCLYICVYICAQKNIYVCKYICTSSHVPRQTELPTDAERCPTNTQGHNTTGEEKREERERGRRGQRRKRETEGRERGSKEGYIYLYIHTRIHIHIYTYVYICISEFDSDNPSTLTTQRWITLKKRGGLDKFLQNGSASLTQWNSIVCSFEC